MSKMQLAIVGRPNVGKSTLFNKIVGERISIVHDSPGVTRDRIVSEASWNGVDFNIIDTGGLDLSSDEMIPEMIRYQTELAIDIADSIVFVVDGTVGMTKEDMEVALMLKKTTKPVIVAVNKIDNVEMMADSYEFYSLGFDTLVPISSIHGKGTGDLLDEIVNSFPKGANEEDEDDSLSIAIIGKPNVGKSSILNAFAKDNRTIVSDMEGTTRDAIDEKIVINGKEYNFIDTAGIRKYSKIYDEIEKYSYIRSVSAVERAKVVLIVIDIEKGVTNQDARIAGIAHEVGKSIIIVMNKWDKIKKETNTMREFESEVREKLAYLSYAPIIFTSAMTKRGLKEIITKIDKIYDNATRRLTTSVLNNVIGQAMLMNQPPSDKGKRLKIYYSTQVAVLPPTFVIFVNDAELFHFSYQRYIENQLRENFDFEGTSIHLIIREREEE